MQLTIYTYMNQLVGRIMSILEKYLVKWFWIQIQKVTQLCLQLYIQGKKLHLFFLFSQKHQLPWKPCSMLWSSDVFSSFGMGTLLKKMLNCLGWTWTASPCWKAAVDHKLEDMITVIFSLCLSQSGSQPSSEWFSSFRAS